jgi:hypothetical protein
LDYLISGILGLITGSVLYGLTYRMVFPRIAAIANLGSVVMPDLWSVDGMLMAVLFAMICLIFFYLLEQGMKRRDRAE